jgi:hypothetical protein
MLQTLVLKFVLLPVALWLIAMLMIAWVGFRRKRGRRTLTRLAVVHGILLLVCVGLFIDLRPSINSPQMTTADKIALKHAVDSARGGLNYRLSFNGGELERGLRTAADLVDIELHSRVQLQEAGRGRLTVCMGLPVFGYVYLSAEGQARIESGDLEFRFNRLQLGRLPIPAVGRDLLVRALRDVIHSEPLATKALGAVVRAEICDGQLELEIRRHMNLTQNVLGELQSGEAAETARRARSVVELWLVETQAEGDLAFAVATRELFGISQRLAPDWPAVRQNQAALLAGAFALGHPRLADLAGAPLEPTLVGSLGQRRNRIRIFNRGDLVQHFWVSAGLVDLANSRISRAAGVTKEEMDSGKGGSGFSFADLLADRAGVHFASIATASEASARRLQIEIAGEWQLADLVPLIEGLPEGISEAELASEYGGPTGPEFQRVSQEIDRRLESCRLLSR